MTKILRQRWLALGSSLLMALAMLPAACRADSSDVAEYDAALKRLQSQIEEYEVTEGQFRGLSIGHSKDQTLADILAMGVQFVRPDFRDRIQVTDSGGLEKLRAAPGLIVGAGDVVVSFDDDKVASVLVAPIFPKWRALLAPAQNRDQVFSALGKILDENPEVVIRNHAPDAEHVLVSNPSGTGRKLLRKYNLWKVSHQDNDGYWGLRLTFDQDRLAKISVWYSLEEIP